MESRSARGPLGPTIPGACLAALLASPVEAQVTSLVSVGSDGMQGVADSFNPSISPDGRYVGFFSYNDLQSGLSAGLSVHSDVYLRDRQLGLTELISVNSSGVPANSYSYNPSLSSDVRWVSFLSFGTNLVAGDTNGPYPIGLDVFVRDRQLGTTERVSIASSGAEANGESYGPSISADGRFVVFYSIASNLVVGDTNGSHDVFLHDRQLGTTERVSVDSNGAQASGDSYGASVSADGRYVAFWSSAGDLVAGDTNLAEDVFVRDRLLGTTERVSVDSGGAQANGVSRVPSISADGRYVGFDSTAGDLVAGDTNGARDIFVRDRLLGTTVRVSVDSGGTEANDDSLATSISDDGRSVAFYSRASNLVSGDTNGRIDVFLRDLQLGTTERVSVDSSGTEGSFDSGIQLPSVSADARYVAFDSRAGLAPGDTNAAHDVYVRDREYAPFVSLCDAGTGGVIACPCSNPPGGPGRGCDNSAGTGGATLAASGVAYLSMDTLVFTSSSERATATSIVLQGTLEIPAGLVFGQGVRCARGALKRLYTKTASGGSITAPDFGAGDATVSARSAALGDGIQPGQSRWYLVYYRDPVVLGGCPATSTFNATQTGEVTWIP